MKLAFAVLVATLVTGARASASQSAGSVLEYQIDIDTAGGFIGGGRGGVTVSPDGSVWAARGMGANRQSSACRTRLSAEERQSLQEAVVSARRTPWPPTFNPEGDKGCCDRIKWTLRLQQPATGPAVQTFVTMWHDGNEKRLPRELGVIKEVAWRAFGRALASCR